MRRKLSSKDSIEYLEKLEPEIELVELVKVLEHKKPKNQIVSYINQNLSVLESSFEAKTIDGLFFILKFQLEELIGCYSPKTGKFEDEDGVELLNLILKLLFKSRTENFYRMDLEHKKNLFNFLSADLKTLGIKNRLNWAYSSLNMMVQILESSSMQEFGFYYKKNLNFSFWSFLTEICENLLEIYTETSPTFQTTFKNDKSDKNTISNLYTLT